MAQAITDVKTFLEDARQAVVELAEFEKQEETLAQEEKKRLRVLETERKAVADAVNSTVKKRRDEIEKSYDDELGKLQDKLKRTRTRREKAKNQGIKERIKEETQELHAHKPRACRADADAVPVGSCSICLQKPTVLCAVFPEGIQRISDGVDYLCDLFPVDPVQHLQAASRTEDFIPGDDLRCGCGCFWRTVYPDWKLDEGSPSGGAAGRTFDPQSDRGEQPQDRGDHLLDPSGSQ